MGPSRGQMTPRSTREEDSRSRLEGILSFDIRGAAAKRALVGLWLAAVLALAVLGALLVGDRSGLRAEYFALSAPWEGRPLYETVGEPGLATTSEIHTVLTTTAVFSVRWSGWWVVADGGTHGFTVDADDGAYIRIDNELVVDSRGVFGAPRPAGSRALEPGFHAIEVGLYQTHGESHLAIHWEAPGTAAQAATGLPLGDLYTHRPLALRQTLRQALAPWPRTYRRLLGVVLLLASALMLRRIGARFAPTAQRVTDRLPRFDGRGLRMALLLGLFAMAFLASFPFTGTVHGGDDTAYLAGATFSEKAWFASRYAHIYLLKLFVALSGGDPILGVRVWWSFVFAATVASLAVAVRSVGPGLQLGTLAATLFVLLAQTALFGLIGAGFADFSVMMFVTVAVAVYLHGLARARDHPPPRYEWHALAVGALTFSALRTKDVGAVLLLLPVLFLIADGRLDLRRFVKRMSFWTAGAAGALMILMFLDGWILGDFLFSLGGGPLSLFRQVPEPPGEWLRQASPSWMDVMWVPGGNAASLSLRNLWVGVVAAAIAAGFCRRRLELRLLHLMPVAYLLALIALYSWLPAPTYSRILIPILPVACLMTGLLLHYAGLDEVPWKQLLEARVLVPGALGAAVIFLIAVPLRRGELEGAGFLPITLLGRLGWKPENFVSGVLWPVLILCALSALALVASSRRMRILALVIAYLAFFGLGFEFNRVSLAKGWSRQQGELLLYPWRVFRDELEAARPRTVALSTDVQGIYGMSALSRTQLAQLVLRREDLYVALSNDLPTGVDVAIASRFVYDRWQREEPALANTAVLGPAGLLVFMRPKEAAEAAGRSADP